MRDIYTAINEGDIDSVAALFDADCVRHYPRGDSPIAGDHAGRDAVIESYRYLLTHTGGNYHVEVLDLLANDVIAASYHRATGQRQRDGAAHDAEMIVRWRIEDGRVTEIWDYSNGIPSLNEFLR